MGVPRDSPATVSVVSPGRRWPWERKLGSQLGKSLWGLRATDVLGAGDTFSQHLGTQQFVANCKLEQLIPSFSPERALSGGESGPTCSLARRNRLREGQ